MLVQGVCSLQCEGCLCAESCPWLLWVLSLRRSHTPVNPRLFGVELYAMYNKHREWDTLIQLIPRKWKQLELFLHFLQIAFKLIHFKKKFVCMGILPACMYVSVWCPRKLEEGAESLGPGVTEDRGEYGVVSCPMGAEN